MVSNSFYIFYIYSFYSPNLYFQSSGLFSSSLTNIKSYLSNADESIAMNTLYNKSTNIPTNKPVKLKIISAQKSVFQFK